MASSRRVLSTVTDTLTSEVVTTSTAVLNRSNTFEQATKKTVGHQHPRRRDVDHRHVCVCRRSRSADRRWSRRRP